MQILTIAGNVGRDAELRHTQSGDAVLGFSVAVDTGKDSQGNKRPAVWYDCSIWGKRATSLNGRITKGTKLTLTGRPTARAHEGKAYLGISVDQLTFQGGGEARSEGRQDSYQAPQQGSGPTSQGWKPDDSEIPFMWEGRV
jgi:single-strand DNA-binding protein